MKLGQIRKTVKFATFCVVYTYLFNGISISTEYLYEGGEIHMKYKKLSLQKLEQNKTI